MSLFAGVSLYSYICIKYINPRSLFHTPLTFQSIFWEQCICHFNFFPNFFVHVVSWRLFLRLKLSAFLTRGIFHHWDMFASTVRHILSTSDFQPSFQLSDPSLWPELLNEDLVHQLGQGSHLLCCGKRFQLEDRQGTAQNSRILPWTSHCPT